MFWDTHSPEDFPDEFEPVEFQFHRIHVDPHLTRKSKVYAYITHRDRLLVFVHPNSPEAGIQVPGGTLEPDERPVDGVLREAREETGLALLEVVSFLGHVSRDMSDVGVNEVHDRYFYHLLCATHPPERWQHGELTPSDGSSAPIPFDFYWVTLPNEAPELAAGMSELLPRLIDELKKAGALC